MPPDIRLTKISRRAIVIGMSSMAIVTPFAVSSRAQPAKDDAFELAQLAQRNLLAMMREARPRRQLALFDVRTRDEYDISHLDGAQRVDPDIAYARFVSEQGARLNGMTVVFYCTTSARSGDLALGVRDGLLQSGTKAVAQLAGGLIAWHNAGLPLVNASGPTRFLHPFDDAVRPHLTHPELARTQRD